MTGRFFTTEPPGKPESHIGTLQFIPAYPSILEKYYNFYEYEKDWKAVSCILFTSIDLVRVTQTDTLTDAPTVVNRLGPGCKWALVSALQITSLLLSQCTCGEASASKLQPCSSLFKCILLAANSHLGFNHRLFAVHVPHWVASPWQAETSLFQHTEQDCFCKPV